MSKAPTWDSGEYQDRLDEINNKLESIKSDTHNLNRIASLRDKQLIITELLKAINKSEIRAAILHLTKDPISRSELCIKLSIDARNLNKFMNAFLDNKAFVTETTKQNRTFYQRSELVDLVGLERDEEFIALLQSWQLTINKKQSTSAVDSISETKDSKQC